MTMTPIPAKPMPQLATGHRILSKALRFMRSSRSVDEQQVLQTLTEPREKIPAHDGATWLLGPQAAVLVGTDGLTVLRVQALHQLTADAAEGFVPITPKLMDSLLECGMTRQVVAGTVKQSEQVVPLPDALAWHLRGPFRALVTDSGTVLRFEPHEGTLPVVLSRQEMAARRDQGPPARTGLRPMPGP